MVHQGEREMAKDNRLLGKFDLVDIPPAPRGVPQIEVTFDIDANGILHVSAKDLGTGKENKIRIESSSGLSKDEIENMVKEGEANAEGDRKKKESIEIKNNADNMCYQVEKNLKDHGDKLEAVEKGKIETEIKNLKEKIASNDMEGMKAGTESLTQASHKLSEIMYKETAGQQGQPNTTDANPTQNNDESAKKDDENIVDADYEVVDEDKDKDKK